MSDGMGREPAYLSSHAINRYFIPNWGKEYINKIQLAIQLEEHAKEISNFYNKYTEI